MSQFRIEPMACPGCNKQEHIRLWEEINATEDITARNKLLNGELFLYRCKKCGYTAAVAYNCIYKDSKNNFMVYLAADGDEKSMKDAMDKVEANAKALAIPGMEYNVRRRIVRTGNSMQEKIIIFEAGLDDRIIEVMKLFYMSAVVENNPGLEIGDCLFCVVNDEWKLELFTLDGKAFSIAMQKDLYKQFVDEYKEKIEEIGETYFVDNSYALNILN